MVKIKFIKAEVRILQYKLNSNPDSVKSSNFTRDSYHNKCALLLQIDKSQSEAKNTGMPAFGKKNAICSNSLMDTSLKLKIFL